MSETPPPPVFTRNPTPPPPKLVDGPAKQLQKLGGRAFTSGRLWIARMGKQQEVGKTEDEAAGKLLARII